MFVCPLSQKYKYGTNPDKDRCDGTQDHRSRVRLVCAWAMKDGQIPDQKTFTSEIEYGYQCIKDAEKEERNKVRINPLWTEWNERTKPKKEKKTTTKEHVENRYTMLEQQIKELKEKCKELTEENDDLTYNIQHEHISMDEYNELVDTNNELKIQNEQNEHYKKLYNDLLEQNKPKEKKKKVAPNNTGKKYKTKNTIIDEVVEELIEDCIDL